MSCLHNVAVERLLDSVAIAGIRAHPLCIVPLSFEPLVHSGITDNQIQMITWLDWHIVFAMFLERAHDFVTKDR